MLAALQAFPIAQPHEVKVVDVDADPALLAEYDELVPVLLAQRPGQPSVRLCHYHLDTMALATYLRQPPA